MHPDLDIIGSFVEDVVCRLRPRAQDRSVAGVSSLRLEGGGAPEEAGRCSLSLTPNLY